VSGAESVFTVVIANTNLIIMCYCSYVTVSGAESGVHICTDDRVLLFSDVHVS